MVNSGTKKVSLARKSKINRVSPVTKLPKRTTIRAAPT